MSNCELATKAYLQDVLRYALLLYRIYTSGDALTDFVESDLENVVRLFRIFNDGTHGSSERFTHSQLQSIRVRVGDAVPFLGSIISGHAFQSA